jgi:hypothetical protein
MYHLSTTPRVDVFYNKIKPAGEYGLSKSYQHLIHSKFHPYHAMNYTVRRLALSSNIFHWQIVLVYQSHYFYFSNTLIARSA